MRTHTRYYAHRQLSCAVWTSAVDLPRSRSNACFNYHAVIDATLQFVEQAKPEVFACELPGGPATRTSGISPLSTWSFKLSTTQVSGLHDNVPPQPASLRLIHVLSGWCQHAMSAGPLATAVAGVTVKRPFESRRATRSRFRKRAFSAAQRALVKWRAAARSTVGTSAIPVAMIDHHEITST